MSRPRAHRKGHPPAKQHDKLIAGLHRPESDPCPQGSGTSEASGVGVASMLTSMLTGYLAGARWYSNGRRAFRTIEGRLGIGPRNPHFFSIIPYQLETMIVQSKGNMRDRRVFFNSSTSEDIPTRRFSDSFRKHTA